MGQTQQTFIEKGLQVNKNSQLDLGTLNTYFNFSPLFDDDNAYFKSI